MLISIVVNDRNYSLLPDRKELTHKELLMLAQLPFDREYLISYKRCLGGEVKEMDSRTVRVSHGMSFNIIDVTTA